MRRLHALNARIADRFADGLATMELFWLLSLLILAAMVVSPPQNLQGWLLYGVSVFFQGVALPVLGYSSKREGAEMRRLLQETHDSVMAEFSDIRAMRAEEHEETVALEDIDARLKALEERGEG